jgi:hypothetical protein
LGIVTDLGLVVAGGLVLDGAVGFEADVLDAALSFVEIALVVPDATVVALLLCAALPPVVPAWLFGVVLSRGCAVTGSVGADRFLWITHPSVLPTTSNKPMSNAAVGFGNDFMFSHSILQSTFWR